MKYLSADVVSIVNYSSPIRDLPLGMENKRLLITSDFHFQIGKEKLPELIVQQINE